jgi:hypothetical protein
MTVVSGPAEVFRKEAHGRLYVLVGVEMNLPPV